MGVGVRLNVERHKEQLAKHGRVELVGEYNGTREKNLYRCLEHGEVHEASGGHAAEGKGLKCCRAAANRKQSTTHGKSRTPTHEVWKQMRKRCNNPRAQGYESYGGRGIKVCSRWDRFSNFLADMGERPEGLTLDRIDVDGDYSPDNCRWATDEEQRNNKRNSVKVMHQGKLRSLTEVSEMSGVKRITLQMRLHRGWPIERAALNIDTRGKSK